MTHRQIANAVSRVKLSLLPSLSFRDRKRLPNCAAVYVVMDGQRVVYVGSTKCLLKRWRRHSLTLYGAIRNKFKICWIQLEVAETAHRFQFEMALKVVLSPAILGQCGKGWCWKMWSEIFQKDTRHGV